MRYLKLISGTSTLLVMTTASSIFVPISLAGPRLMFYYDYLSISTAECVNQGYQVLEELSLELPSRIEKEGSVTFASGENQHITALIDCSEVANSGRVTVMASSNDPEFSLSYVRNILKTLKSLSY